MNLLKTFERDESGATIVEYAVMLALIVAVCIAAITFVGLEAATFWGSSAESVNEIVTTNRITVN